MTIRMLIDVDGWTTNALVSMTGKRRPNIIRLPLLLLRSKAWRPQMTKGNWVISRAGAPGCSRAGYPPCCMDAGDFHGT